MTRRITVQKESLEQALKYCKEHLGGRAATSAKVIELLLAERPRSAEELAKQAECSRAHIFNVLASIRKAEFEQLVGHKQFPTPLLNEVRREELRTKLGKELRCGQDVVNWYRSWSGQAMQKATAYSWCRKLGLPIRSLPKPMKKPSEGEKDCPLLVLSKSAIAELQARQKLEREIYKIPPEKIDCEYPQNPVKRIEGILRCATTGKSMRQIAKELGVAWTDLKRWMIDYKEGIDKLCEIRRGRRPS